MQPRERGSRSYGEEMKKNYVEFSVHMRNFLPCGHACARAREIHSLSPFNGCDCVMWSNHISIT